MLPIPKGAMNTQVMPQVVRQLFSFGLFSLGTGSLFLVDVLVALTQPAQTVAEWALTKQVVLLCGTVVIFGVDQAIVRRPEHAESLCVPLVVQFLVGSVGLAAVASAILPSVNADVLAAAIGLYCINQIAFAWSRAQRKWVQGQVYYALWRFFFLFIVIGTYTVSTTVPVVASMVFALFAAAACIVMAELPGSLPRERVATLEPFRTGQFYGFAAAFALDGFALNLALAADQLWLHALGDVAASATFFKHFVLFVSPQIILNTYLAYVVVPIFRDRRDLAASILLRRGLLLVGAVALSATLLLVSIAAWWLAHRSFATLNLPLALLLTATGSLRLLYAFPLAVVSASGRAEDIRASASYSLLALVPYVGTLVFLEQMSLGPEYVVINVAIAGIVQWQVRYALTSRRAARLMRA